MPTQYTTNYNFPYADFTDRPDIRVYSIAIQDIDAEIKDTQDVVDTIKNIYNEYKTNRDTNGIYTTVTYKRQDNTNYINSTLSNTNAYGQYQTWTLQTYDTDGTTLLTTQTFTLTYNAQDTDPNSNPEGVVRI